ncbi:MAG TPA: MFS transporter [Candidatus Nanopelagicales bacterium]|nr:MFS transporter [Candidatus Nanopelagicales bacterium]
MNRWRPFVTLEVTTILSGTANGITLVAFPWLVLESGGDATAVALIAAAASLPLLVSMLFSGTLIDMLGRRRVAVGSDLLSMVSVALVPVLALTVGLNLWLLAATAVLGAVFDPAGITSRTTMLPETARAAGISLERANGIHETSYGVAFLLGPGVGGLLIGVVGSTATFWATAGGFALAALLMAATRMPGGGRPRPEARPQGIWRTTREGLTFLWRDRVLRAVAVISALVVAFWLPIEGVLLPVYFTDLAQPAQLGLLITAMSGGGAVGSLLYAGWGARFSRHKAFVAALVGCSLPVVWLALLPSFPVMMVLGVLTGFCFGAVNPLINLAMQHRAPAAMRGRIVGVMGSAAYAAGPLGYLVAAPLVQQLGVQHTFLALAVLLLAVSIASGFLPSLRLLDSPPRPESGLGVGPTVTVASQPAASPAATVTDTPDHRPQRASERMAP